MIENGGYVFTDESPQAESEAITEKRLNVTPYMQLKKDWCAAATVQQTLMFINKSSPSQETLAGSSGVGVGPGLQTVLNFLNTKQSRYTYKTSYFTNESTLLSYVNSFYGKNVPAVYTFSASTSQGWPYSTDGHFTNMTGYIDYNGIKAYILADPYYFPIYPPYDQQADGVTGGPYQLIHDIGYALHGSNIKLGY